MPKKTLPIKVQRNRIWFVATSAQPPSFWTALAKEEGGAALQSLPVFLPPKYKVRAKTKQPGKKNAVVITDTSASASASASSSAAAFPIKLPDLRDTILCGLPIRYLTSPSSSLLCSP